jgi:hypothetical protein
MGLPSIDRKTLNEGVEIFILNLKVIKSHDSYFFAIV